MPEPKQPTLKMIERAQAIAHARRLALPAGYKTDYLVCGAFLDANSRGRGFGSIKPRIILPASAKTAP